MRIADSESRSVREALIRRKQIVKSDAMEQTTVKTEKPSCREAFLFWLKLGFVSFGGPAGQIAIMHNYLVDQKRWISDSRFLHALNYCMLLPGRKRSSWPFIRAGSCTASGADWWRVFCLCCLRCLSCWG